VQYFITDRTWRADNFNALGLALDATSIAFHRPGVSVDLQERSAWVPSATIHYLAQRAPGMHDRRIGDGAKDSLGHILATYIVDVDRIANNQDDGDGADGYHPNYRAAAWLSGLPVGAEFSWRSRSGWGPTREFAGSCARKGAGPAGPAPFRSCA
jgi:hypothetical protein